MQVPLKYLKSLCDTKRHTVVLSGTCTAIKSYGQK